MYRVVTENKNLPEIEKILLDLSLDFTYFPATGSWKGKLENSLVIELDNITYHEAHVAALRIGELNNQEAVLIQRIDVLSILIPVKEIKCFS